MRLEVAARVPERGVDARLGVEPGSTVALLGPNGSGKSTLLAVAAGLLRAPDATVTLGEERATVCQDGRTWLPPHRRPLTLLTQDPALFAGMSVLDNVAFGPRARGLSRRAAREQARGWLERVGASSLADKPAHALSGGQAQRVALARALATQPQVLLLDEPLSALDVEAAGAMRTLLVDVLRNVTAVIATHDLLDAAMLADDVMVMHEGTLAESGPRAQVLTRPRHDFTARLAGRGLLRHADGTLSAPRPGQVRLASGDEGLAGTVARVEAHGESVRLWIDVEQGTLACDVDPVTVDPRLLGRGAAVRCTVAAGTDRYAA
ncbi:ABC transporter ATP-binding protein [Demequina sp. NBRC 110057]|uniref:ABC transporter ATP-binding protein n=1 Tax=Demequina sp. NBRC 110057 TaxID=1570346 RepID=UPI000A00EBAE|nr:ABC transporter ATP-binding protein [Demequina sp. NBRC 110057]